MTAKMGAQSKLPRCFGYEQMNAIINIEVVKRRMVEADLKSITAL